METQLDRIENMLKLMCLSHGAGLTGNDTEAQALLTKVRSYSMAPTTTI